MDERAEFFFGADLFGDVDSEAEDVGLASGDELVAEGDDAGVAACRLKLEAALGLAGLRDLLEVVVEGGAALGLHEGSERGAGHLPDGTAERFRAMAVDRVESAVERVGEDHAERTFDKLAIAGFGLAEGGFGGALLGDVDAGSDDEGGLVLFVDERRSGPRDAADGAVAMPPVIFEAGGEVA